MVSFLFGWRGFPQVLPFYHQPTQTLALERCHCQVHLPFLEPTFSPTVGEEGEDEEDEEERLSCFIGVRKDDEDVEEELVKPGTTIGTKFSVLQMIRIPFLKRCGF